MTPDPPLFLPVMLDKIASAITSHRGKLFVFMVAVLAAMALLTRMPAFDGSFNGFILEDNPAYITGVKIDSVFKVGKPVFVKIVPEDKDCRTVLRGMRELDRNIRAVSPACSTISVKNIITASIPPERYDEPFSSVLHTLAGYPLYRDLVSRDERSCGLLLSVPNDSLFHLARFDSVVALRYDGIKEVKAISLYHIEQAVSDNIQKDLLKLSTLISLFFAVYLYFAYRNMRALLFAGVIIGTAVTSSLFFFSVLGYGLNQITTLAIPVLVVISLSDVVHLLSGYAHLRHVPDASARIKEVVKFYMVPSFFSSATTSSAFLSFYIFNESEYIRQFGLVTAIIVLFEFFVTFLLGPFLLQYIRLDRSAPAVLSGVVRFLERYQKQFTIGFIVFMLGSVAFVGSLRYDSDPEMFYPRGTKVEALHKEFRNDFYTGNPAEILVEPLGTASPGYDSLARAAVKDLTARLETRADVASVNSVGKDNYVPSAMGIPVNVLDYMGSNNPFVSRDGKYFRIQLNFKDLADIVAFNEHFKDFVGPWGKVVNVNFTSGTLLVKEMDARTASSLFNSLFLSGAFIACILFVLTRSVLLTLVSFVPNLIPLAMVIYMFYFGGMDINILTAISAVICLGLLDDDTVHILYRKLVKQQPLEEVSVSILSTSVLLSGGFAFFALSSFVPTRIFGLICAVVFFVGVISEITATAYLTGLLKDRHDRRMARKAKGR